MHEDRSADRAGRDRCVALFSGGGTGGHLYPALALAESLVELRPDVHPVFVGARRGIESRVFPERGVEHLLLPVEGWHRNLGLSGNRAIPGKLVRSLATVAEFVQKWRPAVTVLTGGYASAPAGMISVLRGIPIVLQEQNAAPGAVTRSLAPFARQIHLAFPEAAERLPGAAREAVRMSGNPIRRPLELGRVEARRALGLPEGGVLVLVVGGSQGSAALNERLLSAVEEVVGGRLPKLQGLRLLWSTGPRHLEAIEDRLAALGSPDWVEPVGYLDEMPTALAAADLAVSRAGAMATSEFLAQGLPTILVPLPTAAADHQRKNAVDLEAAGAAVHLAEEGLDATALWAAIGALAGDPGRRATMSVAAKRRGRPDASRVIASEIAGILPPASPTAGTGGSDGSHGGAR